jgi:hypothetical protein
LAQIVHLVSEVAHVHDKQLAGQAAIHDEKLIALDNRRYDA